MSTFQEVPEIERIDGLECITDNQATFFLDNGYLILRNVLASEELSRLQNVTEKLIKYGTEAVRDDPDYMYAPGHKTGAPRLKRIEYIIDKTEEGKALLGHPFILRSVERIVGRDLLPTWDSMVLKLPEEGIVVPWHRDAGAAHVGDVPIFNVDFYLDEADRDTCVWAYPGSHLWSQEQADAVINRPGFETDGAVPLIMHPGDVLFHNILLLHGSPPNDSGKLRRVIYYEFRTAKVEAAKGPHTPEYIPLKQRVLCACIEHRKQASFAQGEKPFQYDPPEPFGLDGDGLGEPLLTYRYAHGDYWRKS